MQEDEEPDLRHTLLRGEGGQIAGQKQSILCKG